MATPQLQALNDELEEDFRYMIVQVANGLKREDCENIVYWKGLPKSTCSPEPEIHNVKLLVLVTLEARGFISPLNPDALQSLLTKIHRQDLTHFVEEYVAKQATLLKKIEKERKKSIKKRGKKNTENTSEEKDFGPSIEELFAIKAASSTKEQLKKLQTLTLSYISRLMLNAQALHAVIHDDASPEGDLSKKEEACRAVINETSKFSHRFCKVLSAAGISSSKGSTSSEESGYGHIDDERRLPDHDSPMLQRRNATTIHQSPKVYPKSRQLNSPAHSPAMSRAWPVIVGLPPPPPQKQIYYNSPVAQETTATDTGARGQGTNAKPRQGPIPLPKPRSSISTDAHFSSTKSSKMQRVVDHDKSDPAHTNPGSGDSGIVVHSLPSLIDAPGLQGQEHQYENVWPTEHVYEYLDDNFRDDVHTKLKPMRTRASSMDDMLYQSHGH